MESSSVRKDQSRHDLLRNSGEPSSSTLQPNKERNTQDKDAIRVRFLQQVQALIAQGFATQAEICEQVGAGGDFIYAMTKNRRHPNLAHIRRLKDVYNADFHYILFGVENPDPTRRGKYRKPSQALQRDPDIVNRLEAWISYRFIKEVERMEREGRIDNQHWLLQELGVEKNTFTKIRAGELSLQPYVLPRIKELINADYHFILWGIEHPDISGAFKFMNGQQVRIDIYTRRLSKYSKPATWTKYITPRDPEDDFKRLDREYYRDLPTLKV